MANLLRVILFGGKGVLLGEKKALLQEYLSIRGHINKGEHGIWKSFGHVCSGEGLLLCVEMLFYDMYVQCKGISSDAMVKHQSNGCGATCSNSHAVAALYFFPKPYWCGARRNGERVKKTNEINTHESGSCLKLKFVSNILWKSPTML